MLSLPTPMPVLCVTHLCYESVATVFMLLLSCYAQQLLLEQRTAQVMHMCRMFHTPHLGASSRILITVNRPGTVNAITKV